MNMQLDRHWIIACSVRVTKVLLTDTLMAKDQFEFSIKAKR